MDKVKTNPFITRMNISSRDKMKLIAGAILIMPIRLILVLALVILSSLVGFSLVVVTTLTGYKDTLYAKSPFKLLCLNATTKIFSLAMFIAGLKITVVDKRSDDEKSRKTGIMIVAPHSSHFDFGSMLAIGPKTPVAKQEDRKNPFFGSQLILCNGILVKRNDEASRHQVIKEITERSKGEEVGIFPEATVTDGSSLIQFKAGGFIPGLPVSPAIVKYKFAGTVNTVSWTWRSPSIFYLWLLSCASWSQTESTITFLPVYYPNEDEKKDPALFAENVRRYMGKELNIPLSRYSFEEAFFLEFATKAKISLSPAVLKLVKVAHKLTRLPTPPTIESAAKSPTSDQIKSNSNGHLADRDELRHRQSNGSSNGVNGVKKGIVNGAIITSNGSAVEKSIEQSEKKWSHQNMFKSIVSESIERLSRNATPNRAVRNVSEMVSLLSFPFPVDAAIQQKLKAALGDFFASLLVDEQEMLTETHVLVFLQLVDTSLPAIWDRIELAESTLKEAGVSDKSSLKIILWYLLGLEQSLIDEQVLEQLEFSTRGLKRQLIKTFRTAVEDNAAHLFSGAS